MLIIAISNKICLKSVMDNYEKQRIIMYNYNFKIFKIVNTDKK